MLAAADLPQAKDYNPKEDMRTSGEGVQLVDGWGCVPSL